MAWHRKSPLTPHHSTRCFLILMIDCSVRVYSPAERDACGVLSKYVLAISIFAAVMICGHFSVIGGDVFGISKMCCALGGAGWVSSVVGSFVFSWVAIGFYGNSDGDNCSAVFPAMYKMSLANIIILIVAVGLPACCMAYYGDSELADALLSVLDLFFCAVPRELQSACCGVCDCCAAPPNNNRNTNGVVIDASLPLDDRAGRRGGGGGGNRQNQRDGAPPASDAPPLIVVVPNAAAPDRNAAPPV